MVVRWTKWEMGVDSIVSPIPLVWLQPWGLRAVDAAKVAVVIGQCSSLANWEADDGRFSEPVSECRRCERGEVPFSVHDAGWYSCIVELLELVAWMSVS